MTSDNRASWRNPRLLLAISMIFVAGALVGALAMRFGVPGLAQQSAAYYPVGDKRIAVQQLSKELNLSASQTQQLEVILDDFVMYMQMLQAQMDEVRANGKERILRVLDEKQRDKFEKMLGGLQQARRAP